MQFDFSDDQRLLREQVRRFLDARCPRACVRAALEDSAPLDRALWGAMADMGLLGVAIPERFGGSDAGYLELCVIAEELGRALAPAPATASIYLATELLLLLGTEAQKERYLPKLAQGAWIGTLALAEGAGDLTAASMRVRLRAGRLTGTKSPVPSGVDADFAVVPARGDDGRITLALVDLCAPEVDRQALAAIDPTSPLARLTFADAPCEALGPVGEGWAPLLQVLDRAAVLVAFEQLGGADRSLEMARDYALERMAFGRPIGSFQAIKHMLADMYVSASLARSNAYYGAWALTTEAPELPIAAATARVSATEAFQHCARNNIQVHGGMGFTWASDCHLFYRRSNHLALVLGGASHWADALVDRLQGRAT